MYTVLDIREQMVVRVPAAWRPRYWRGLSIACLTPLFSWLGSSAYWDSGTQNIFGISSTTADNSQQTEEILRPLLSTSCQSTVSGSGDPNTFRQLARQILDKFLGRVDHTPELQEFGRS